MHQEAPHLHDRLVLITGGTGGIGRVVASHMCAQGDRVCIIGTHEGRLEQSLKALEVSYPNRVHGLCCDIGSWKSAEAAVTEAAQRMGGLDVLVNAAGIQAPIGEFLENDITEWEHNLAVNLLGAVYCSKAALKYLLKGRDPAIVNFSGGGATGSRVNFSAYAVAKTGLIRFTEVLAEELRPRGVRVNAIAPGAINTRMLDEVLSAGSKVGEKEMQEAAQRSLVGGASADGAAELVVFLASPRSMPLTGKLISAVWDPWRSWDQEALDKIMAGTQFTLRRIS